MNTDELLAELRNEAGTGSSDAVLVTVNSDLLRRAANDIELLRHSLRLMLETYWTDDGRRPPNFIREAAQRAGLYDYVGYE